MISFLGRVAAGVGLQLLAGLAHAQLSVAPINGTTITPSTLAQSLLGQNSQITITGSSYVGANVATGTFGGGTGTIGIETGFLLTSGSVLSVLGPNNNGLAGVDLGLDGDTDLDALVPEGSLTRDASVLTITFVPAVSTIQFSYVFGSEEYNDYVNEINDVFGLFVNGVNWAVIPRSSTPVAINNINCGNSGRGTPPPGPGKNCNLYVNNDPPTRNIQLDGLTRALSFTAPVNPNVPNTLKIAIADTSDYDGDSAVFIAAGTLCEAARARSGRAARLRAPMR